MLAVTSNQRLLIVASQTPFSRQQQKMKAELFQTLNWPVDRRVRTPDSADFG